MSEWIWTKVKTGGFFSGVKVGIEIKFVRPMTNGEAQSMTMFRDDDGKTVGKLEYEISGADSKITVFSIQDWSSPRFAEKLTKEFLGLLKKKKVKVIKIEIYDTDNKTHDKLTLFRSLGFSIESGGNVTGYTQYHLIKQL